MPCLGLSNGLLCSSPSVPSARKSRRRQAQPRPGEGESRQMPEPRHTWMVCSTPQNINCTVASQNSPGTTEDGGSRINGIR